MTTTLTFKTADEAIEQLLQDGFERTDYDPVYPYMIVYNDGDGMMARVTWDNNRERYIIEGAHI